MLSRGLRAVGGRCSVRVRLIVHVNSRLVSFNTTVNQTHDTKVYAALFKTRKFLFFVFTFEVNLKQHGPTQSFLCAHMKGILVCIS